MKVPNQSIQIPPPRGGSAYGGGEVNTRVVSGKTGEQHIWRKLGLIAVVSCIISFLIAESMKRPANPARPPDVPVERAE